MQIIDPDTTTVNIWMKLYVKDILSQFAFKTNAELGAWIRCASYYWVKEGPMTDDEIRKAAGKDFDGIKEMFVQFSDPGKPIMWGCPHLDQMMESAREERRKLRERAMKGVNAKKAKLQDKLNGKPTKARIPKKVSYL